MSRLLDALKNLQQPAERKPAEKKIVPRLAASIRHAMQGEEATKIIPSRAPAVLFRVPNTEPQVATPQIANSPTAIEFLPPQTVPQQAVIAKPIAPVAKAAPIDAAMREVLASPDAVGQLDSISDSIRQIEPPASKAPLAPLSVKAASSVRPQAAPGEREVLELVADANRSEPYLKLIGAIAKETAAVRLPVITLLGVEERDATSFVAAVVATLIAQQRECKVLLMEANARTGQFAERYGLEDAVGLSELLAGRASHAEVVAATSSPNLDVLPFGQANAAQSKLLPVILKDELADMRTAYGATILDGGPLASDWALAASQAADATYLLVRLNDTSAETATARVNRFRSLGGRLTGCIAIGETAETV